MERWPIKDNYKGSIKWKWKCYWKNYLANTGALTGAQVTALTSTDIDNYINDGTFVEYLDNKNQLESYEIDTDATGQSMWYQF